MNRLTLERRQVWVYLVALLAGLALGATHPGVAPMLEWMLWPTLTLLLYVTFLQVPLLHLRDAFADARFVCATLLGNFVLVPAIVAVLIMTLPDDPALRLGVLLVLLVPCTDWFVSFSQLGGGDVPRAIAVTPLNLLLQVVLLPVYLWWMADLDIANSFVPGDFAPALAVILIPLALAAASERWIEARSSRAAVRETLAWWPVPLLALVVFMIAGAQIGGVRSVLHELLAVLPAFALFLLAAALLAKLVARLFRLPVRQGRTLAFGFGTRNSFVVLPFALSLPSGWELVAMVVVVQSLVELVGMMIYLWWIPGRLFREEQPLRPRH